MQQGSRQLRTSTKRYTTDAKPAISRDDEGDEIRSTVSSSGNSLVFEVEEHEDDRVLRTRETWTLIDDGNAIQRVRQNANSNLKQTLVYVKAGE